MTSVSANEPCVVTVIDDGDAIVILVRGDVDLHTIHVLDGALGRALAAAAPAARRVAVDLGEATFVGAEALRSLVRVAHGRRELGDPLVLRGVPPLTLRLIAALGFASLFASSGAASASA